MLCNQADNFHISAIVRVPNFTIYIHDKLKLNENTKKSNAINELSKQQLGRRMADVTHLTWVVLLMEPVLKPIHSHCHSQRQHQHLYLR
jgi:hypothetical protein